jgi:hypothetical protein
MRSLSTLKRPNAACAQAPARRLLGPAARTASLAVAALAATLVLIAGLYEPQPAARAGGFIKQCLASQEITLPRELAGDEPLKIKDGEYTVGSFRVPEGLIELKMTIARGKKADLFLSRDGKRLQPHAGPLSADAEKCAKESGLSAVSRRTIFERLASLLEPTAQAADCSHLTSFKITRDCKEDGSSCIYFLWGRTSGGWRLCSIAT